MVDLTRQQKWFIKARCFIPIKSTIYGLYVPILAGQYTLWLCQQFAIENGDL